jgi:hypothetical protein
LLLVVFCTGLGGLLAGSLLRRVGWSRAWIAVVVGNLLIRLGVLIVFLSISVFSFTRGGPWYLALGVLFALLSVAGAVIWVLMAVAVFGGDSTRTRLARTLTRLKRSPDNQRS